MFIRGSEKLSVSDKKINRIINIGGGVDNAYSLLQLDHFCRKNIDTNKQVNRISENRNFDIPLHITDHSLATSLWDWSPTLKAEQILEEILSYANSNLEHIKQIS